MRTYTVIRNKRAKGDFRQPVLSISVGNHSIDFSPNKHVYRNVPESLAVRAKETGEFSIKLESLEE